MTDTLDIFGTRYTNVTGIIATDSGGNELTYTRGGGQPTLQTKTTTYTPTESQQTATITADTGYDGLEEVDITVYAISSSYVGSGITRRSSSDLTVSGATVTAPAGYYSAQATKSVASGTAGTPTATKGTVSNHAVTVTPSVTNTAGYISGGTKTGTGVSVSASELVSGTYSVTSSGTKDVTNYASISVPSGTEGTPTATKGSVSNHSVSVTPSVTNTAGYISGTTKTGTAVTVTASELVSGSETKTANGTYDVTNLASLVVNVSGGSSNFTLLGTQSVGSINTTSTTATDTGVTITVKGVYAYDLLVCECSVNTKTNGRHAATTRVCWLTASSAVATKDAGTFATATWNCKLSSNGTATTRASTTMYGVYANGITLSAGSTGDNGQAVIPIYRRYNNQNTGTINGSYTMRVYGVKIYDLIGG